MDVYILHCTRVRERSSFSSVLSDNIITNHIFLYCRNRKPTQIVIYYQIITLDEKKMENKCTYLYVPTLKTPKRRKKLKVIILDLKLLKK